MSKKRHKFSVFRLFFTGAGMGTADIVPGVSGGTIAFISGIYENLIENVRITTGTALRELLRGRVRSAGRMVPWRFFLPLGIGIITAVFLLAQLISFLLDTYPVFLWSFFFGLVAASAYVVRKQVQNWLAPSSVIAVLLAAIGAFVFSGLAPNETPATLFAFFISGAIAISAMILPGISGSFLLVLMGKYQQVLTAVAERDFVILFVFCLGILVGIALFSHLLGWLLRRYRDTMIAFLTGLMIGSLRRIWPWKEAPDGVIDGAVNVLPPVFDMSVAGAIFLAFLGAGVIFTVERFTITPQHDD